MNKFPIIFQVVFFVLLSSCAYSQNQVLKEYSYTELFQMIEQEKDTVFELNDANIVFNEKTDKRFVDESGFYNKDEITKIDKIVVNKKLIFRNVDFDSEYIYTQNGTALLGSLNNIQFNKDVYFEELYAINILNCVFLKKINIGGINNPVRENKINSRTISFKSCVFKSSMDTYMIDCSGFHIRNCIFSSSNFYLKKIDEVGFYNNTFRSKEFDFYIEMSKVKSFTFIENTIEVKHASFFLSQEDPEFNQLEIENNKFPSIVYLDIKSLKTYFVIPWSQFENKVIYVKNPSEMFNYINLLNLSYEIYKSDYLIKNERTFNSGIAFRSLFYNNYKSVFNKKDANAVYREMKDLETDRLSYLYQENPSFKTYFTWKINQFLKVFSAYGTEPALAVIFSMYVILIFALFYAFFPNTWESNQRKGWVQRFSFFQNYMLNNEGIHTIYLNKKNQKLSSYQEFIENLEKTKLDLPMFFVRWTKPLYKISMLSTVLTTKILQKGDVMSGKWQDLSKNQKRIKSFQIGVLIIFSLLYDLFIKLLNALTLSINMFSTLGFGEIPIKGIPRYLAIIQGFIGWFMLTIFSVSLISQLLG